MDAWASLRSNRCAHTSRQALARTADGILLAYYIAELQYWVNLVSDSKRLNHRRLLSRLVSALSFAYNACAAAIACLKLRQLGSSCQSDDATASQRLQLRRDVAKLALDSVLALHWSVDGPAFALHEWQVGVIGTASACLGLRKQVRAHCAKTIK